MVEVKVSKITHQTKNKLSFQIS